MCPSEKTMKGTCDQMCPKEEIKRREKERLIHVLEATDDSRGSRFLKADHSRIVKEFTRSAYGSINSSPDSLRTVQSLRKTTDYLINTILPITSYPFNLVYDFCNDRFRAIRQEIIIQRITGPDKVYMLEQMTLFHVYSSYLLCEAEYRTFDPVLNKQYLHECLNVLLTLYDEVNCGNEAPGHGDSTDGDSQLVANQISFESIFLLTTLGSETSLRRSFILPISIRDSSMYQQCYELSICHLLGNYHRVLVGIPKLPVILWMAAYGHIHDVQLKYLIIINASYMNHDYEHLVSKLVGPFEAGRNADVFICNLLELNKFKMNGDNVVLKNKNILTIKGLNKVKFSKLNQMLVDKNFKFHVDNLFKVMV